jgi:hypothetical protein
MPSCVLVSIACFVVIERPARNSLSGQGTIPAGASVCPRRRRIVAFIASRQQKRQPVARETGASAVRMEVP